MSHWSLLKCLGHKLLPSESEGTSSSKFQEHMGYKDQTDLTQVTPRATMVSAHGSVKAPDAPIAQLDLPACACMQFNGCLWATSINISVG